MVACDYDKILIQNDCSSHFTDLSECELELALFGLFCFFCHHGGSVADAAAAASLRTSFLCQGGVGGVDGLGVGLRLFGFGAVFFVLGMPRM